MVSSTQSAWIWANSWRWLRIGKPSVLPSVGLQRIRQDLYWTIIATYGEMQCLGLFVIPLIFISATWGQHPCFFFVFFFDFSHPPLSQLFSCYYEEGIASAGSQALLSLLGVLIHVWRPEIADGCYILAYWYGGRYSISQGWKGLTVPFP